MAALLKVYYDGLCRVCSFEIEHYRKHDPLNKINFVDISSPQFSAADEGLNAQAVQKYLHARRADGTLLLGVDSFVEIWNVLPKYHVLARLSRFRIVRFLLEMGYRVFIRVRPYLPRKKALCDTDHCQF